ncbi:MAG: NmrA/HSCARG family protein [Burkholderiales bacterium]
MTQRKTIAVVGATGAQGGGLVRAILADPQGGFAARAITRDVNSDKAKALAALGAEVVAGDVDDEASLARAFAGAHGAFCVTFFWAHFKPELEIAQARNMARAAKTAGLSHVIWSTLEDTRAIVPPASMPTLMGQYKVPHFDAKGEADQFFRESGVPTTYLYASYYWDNLIYFGAGPAKGPDGNLYFTLPTGNAKMAGVAAEDIGRVAYGIFKAGAKYAGQKVGVAGEHLTGAEMAAKLSAALGKDIRHNAMSPEAYRALGFPGAEDLGNMFQFYRDFEGPLNALRDVSRSRELNPSLMSFDQWLAKHKDRIPPA